MMAELSIGSMGLLSTDMRLLSRLIRLTRSGDTALQYVAAQTTEDAQIMIVNMDDEQSLADWEVIAQQRPEMQIIFASSEPQTAPAANQLCLPLRVLPVLDSLEKIALSSLETQDSDEYSLNTGVSNQDEPVSALSALVVDDSLPVRQSLAYDLEELGFEVDAYETGEQALDAARQSPDHSMVFLDVVLPGIDGYEVCRRLRQEQAYKQVPIVMLTGKSSSFDKVRGSLAGCDDYLMKPVKKPQLEALANKHVAALMVARDSY